MKAKKVTVKQMQELTGSMNFLCRAYPAGKAFNRRLYTLGAGKGLKQHHHVSVNRETRLDCFTWVQFLFNECSLRRPFSDFLPLNPTDVGFFTDASKNHALGMGGVFGKHWFFTQWEKNYIRNCNLSINYLELLAVATGIYLWAHEMKGKHVLIHCDNKPVVDMINASSSTCKNCMLLI